MLFRVGCSRSRDFKRRSNNQPRFFYLSLHTSQRCSPFASDKITSTTDAYSNYNDMLCHERCQGVLERDDNYLYRWLFTARASILFIFTLTLYKASPATVIFQKTSSLCPMLMVETKFIDIKVNQTVLLL